jgi:hypothetical protein
MKSFLLKTVTVLTISALAVSAFTPALHAAPKKILLYEPTLVGTEEKDFINSHSTGPNPEFQAIGQGSAVYNEQQWVNATVAEFQQFDAIIISDHGVSVPPDPQVVQAVAVASRAIWGSAVNGNILIVSGDPRADHDVTDPTKLPPITEQGIRFAAEQPGDTHSQTGLYIALDHVQVGDSIDAGIQNPTEIPILSWLGSFRAIDLRGFDNQVRMVLEHPILDVIGRNVGGYGVGGGGAPMQGFYSWPAQFYPVAYRLYDPAPTPTDKCTPLVEGDTG